MDKNYPRFPGSVVFTKWTFVDVCERIRTGVSLLESTGRDEGLVISNHRIVVYIDIIIYLVHSC